MAQQHIQHLTLEIRDNLKEGIHTTKASDTFQKLLDIQHILTENNALQTMKLKQKRTPQVMDNLLELTRTRD